MFLQKQITGIGGFLSSSVPPLSVIQCWAPAVLYLCEFSSNFSSAVLYYVVLVVVLSLICVVNYSLIWFDRMELFQL